MNKATSWRWRFWRLSATHKIEKSRKRCTFTAKNKDPKKAGKIHALYRINSVIFLYGRYYNTKCIGFFDIFHEICLQRNTIKVIVCNHLHFAIILLICTCVFVNYHFLSFFFYLSFFFSQAIYCAIICQNVLCCKLLTELRSLYNTKIRIYYIYIFNYAIHNV